MVASRPLRSRCTFDGILRRYLTQYDLPRSCSKECGGRFQWPALGLPAGVLRLRRVRCWTRHQREIGLRLSRCGYLADFFVLPLVGLALAGGSLFRASLLQCLVWGMICLT